MQFERHQLELFLAFIFIVCVANYFIGTIMNRRHAQAWLTVVAPVVRRNFKHVGTQDIQLTSEGDEPIGFEDSSANEFPLLLNGRQNMIYANLNLVLAKRHDIAQLLGSAFLGKCVEVQQDVLWIEIPIARGDQIMAEILLV